jgi:hypothetical protein
MQSPGIVSHRFQHAFENLEPEAKDGIVDELLNQGPAIFGEVAKNQWGSYCIQHSMSYSMSLFSGETKISYSS